jgi:signal transduction histidine kinase
MGPIRPKSGSRVHHQRGQDFLHAAAAASPHGLMVEHAGRVAYANVAFARLLGFGSENEVLGQRVSNLPQPKGDVLNAENGNGPEWQTIRLEFRHERQKMALHVVRDISEHRRLERRLRESEKMEALGRLVGGVAHDFNNILTAINLYSDLLRDRCEKEMYGEIAEIREAAQRGGDMVRQLLTFARQQPMTARVVSLRHVIAGMNAVMEPLIGEDIELITHFAAKPDCIRADPSQLQQVILNLVMNARDAMPAGGRIRIETSSQAVTDRSSGRHHGIHPGRYVSLCIADTGCGMSEEVRDRIFEPFFTTKKEGAGTGLGMAMVYGIVTQSGGTITIHSRPGKGTRVCILLPEAPQCECEGQQVGSEPPVCSGAETVLLVEDDAAVRTSMARLLMATGYRVLQAHDGAHALRVAKSHSQPIQLLLTDMVMPRMNGAESARQIRRLHPETKVLFVSGYPAKARAEVTGHPLLYKPFSRAVLARKVREMLDEHTPVDGVQQPASRGTS